jgi:GH24 family phage-related lysozyme (muramidase)
MNERLSKAEKDAMQAKKDALGGLNPKDILSDQQALPEDPVKQPGGKNLKTADYASQALQAGNLQYALTAQAEGVMFRRHKDPSKGENIGVGFSLTSRSKPEVLSMLRRAGVPSSDVDAVFDGKMEVSPKVVERLHAIAVPEYQKQAISAIGSDSWKKLTPEAQAVLTDMAWATGKPSQFTQVLDAMRKGDWNGASAALSLKYTDRQTGEQKDDVRRVNLWRLMLSGRKTYADYLSKHTTQ